MKRSIDSAPCFDVKDHKALVRCYALDFKRPVKEDTSGYCVREAGHDGPHRSKAGAEWAQRGRR